MHISYFKPGIGRVRLQLPVNPQGKVIPFPQQKKPASNVDRFQGKWEHHVAIAKIAWGGLTEAQLVKSQGRKDKLSDLIQRRYAMSPPDADAQVENLIQKCGY
jgi:hypothetical protein